MEFKRYQLKEICSYTSIKIPVENVQKHQYISTDNMLPNRDGIAGESEVPNNGKVNSFQKGNILISNIRPYFKKIWFADKSGASSPDVLIFEAKNEKVSPEFLYYILSQDNFFDYVMKSSKGTKMPRGDKQAIMKYEAFVFSEKVQKKIVNILESLDKKIAINKELINTMEEISQTLFKNWFIDFEFPNEEGKPYKSSGGEMVESELGNTPKGWSIGNAGDILEFSPKETIAKNTLATFVEMKNLNTSAMVYDYIQKPFKSGSKFKNGDTLLARITPCLENGKIGFVDFLAKDEVGWGSTEFITIRTKNNIPSSFSYYFASEKNFKNYAIKNMNGSSGRQRVKAETLSNYLIALPPKELIQKFTDISDVNMKMMTKLKEEILTLKQLRDTLLPKLLSGEIEIPDELEV